MFKTGLKTAFLSLVSCSFCDKLFADYFVEQAPTCIPPTRLLGHKDSFSFSDMAEGIMPRGPCLEELY